jgi:hypothetical protein
LVGQVTVEATAVLTGIGAGTQGELDFDVSTGPADQGQPYASETAMVSGPGSYPMPKGVMPPQAGIWYVTVHWQPTSGTGQGATVTGAPTAGNPSAGGALRIVLTAP